MSIVARLTWMEMKLFFRDKQNVFWTFLFPILMIWLFGSLFGDQRMPGGLSYSNMYVPSWIGVNLLTTSLFTIGTALVLYRVQGILRRYQATPLRPQMVLGAHMLWAPLSSW
ncbi:MAG: ABC transporter permease [Planifilum sp.]